MKYISYFDPNTGDPAIVTFEDSTQHSHKAAAMGLKNCLLGAGFVTQGTDGHLRCTGRSLSLNLDSRKEDTALLHKHLNKQK